MVAVAREKQPAFDFGQKLRERREAKGWTQAELAERAEMNYQDISRLERGERAPSWETLLRLADALEEPLDAFRPPHPPRPMGKRK